MGKKIPLNWLLIGAVGVLYLLYAKKSGMAPFNAGGLADKYLPGVLGVGSDSGPPPSSSDSGQPSFPMGPGGGGVSIPPPLDPARMTPQQMMAGRDIYGNPVKPGTNPFEAPMAPGMIDLGSGYQMPNPSGVPNSFGSGASKGTQFQSTVANDPTPTNYGIYTQYLNGLRNEYLTMDEQRRVTNAQDMGIGGDITTLPQPPVVGATPFNYPGPQGLTPPGMPRPPSFGPPVIGGQLGGMPQQGGQPVLQIGQNGQISYGAPMQQQYPQQPTGYTMNNPSQMVPGMSSGYPQAYPSQYNGPPAYSQGPILYPPGPRAYAATTATGPRIQRLEDRLGRINNRERKVKKHLDIMQGRTMPNSTRVLYDEDTGHGGPSDISGIRPTFFNLVSRNQPGGNMSQKIGNVR